MRDGHEYECEPSLTRTGYLARHCLVACTPFIFCGAICGGTDVLRAKALATMKEKVELSLRREHINQAEAAAMERILEQLGILDEFLDVCNRDQLSPQELKDECIAKIVELSEEMQEAKEEVQAGVGE